MEGELLHVRLEIPACGAERLAQRQVGGVRRQRLERALEVALLHGEDPAGEVAESVRQLGVQSRHQRRLAEVGVLSEGHLAQQEVAEDVVPVARLHLQWLDDVAEALLHLGAIARPVAVHADGA